MSRARVLAAKADPPSATRVAVLARLFDATLRLRMVAEAVQALLAERRDWLQRWPQAPWTAMANLEADAATVALL